MTDFSASLTPIAVPSLASSSADAIAQFQANFATNIVTTGNSLLQAYIALKDTDFFAVGDYPDITNTLLSVDPDFFSSIDTKPATPAISFEDLSNKIDQLSALAAPAIPALATPDAEIPTLDAAAPAVALPAAPSTDVGAAPEAAPSLEAPVVPDAPQVVLPSVPTLEDLRLPEPPAFTLPEWSAVAPQNLLTPPSEAFSYVDPGYTSALHDPLVQKLLRDLEQGSYGIETADEDALWFRARDRAAQQVRAAVDEATRRAAATGLPLPPGHVFELARQEEHKGQQILSEANRDIALRRSELYVEGRKFTIEQVQGYERIRIDLYNATQERALNYAKAVVEMGIAIYDAGVRNFSTQLEAYKAEAQVFESRVRGELVKAEVFKAQIEAESQRMAFNRAKLEAYDAQLRGIDSVVRLYKARLEAAQLFMQLQGQKLDVFRTQVQTFAERVRAKEAEYGVYRAQIAGQLANLDVYKAQIDAHNARLGSTEARARIQLQGNEALLQAYRTAVVSYQAQLESFGRQIDARLEEAKTRTVVYGSEVDAYRAFTDANMAGARLSVVQNGQVLDWNKAQLLARTAKVDHRFKQLAASVELQKDVNKNGIEFLRTALGGAVSGLNSLGVRTEEG